MVIKNIDFEKYNKMAEKSFYRKLGKVVNVVGLTIESAGPDSKLGDLCRILPDAEGARPIMAEVVGFRDKKTLHLSRILKMQRVTMAQTVPSLL